MATTVQVSEETRERLATFRDATGAATYDEAIVRLLRGTETESAFGSMADWGPWREEDRLHARSDEGGI